MQWIESATGQEIIHSNLKCKKVSPSRNRNLECTERNGKRARKKCMMKRGDDFKIIPKTWSKTP